MWEIVTGGLVADEPIDPSHLSWMVYAYGLDGFARERAVSRNPNVMGYPIPLSFSFCHSSLTISITNPSLFELQLTIQEHEELVWLAGNLKLEVTNYSRSLYGLGRAAHPGNGGGDDEKDLEATLSYQPRKRRYH